MRYFYPIFVGLATGFLVSLGAYGQSEESTIPEGIPLRFSVIGRGVEVEGPWLDYDLSSGQNLRVGSVLVNEESFLAELQEKSNSQVLVLSWPRALLNHGTVEFLTRSGRVLLSKNLVFKPVELENPGEQDLASVEAFDLQEVKEVLDYQSPFRICVGTATQQFQTRFCSVEFLWRKVQRKWTLQQQNTVPRKPRVIIRQQEQPLKGRVALSPGESTQFFAEFSNEVSFQFGTTVSPLEVLDLVDLENGQIELLARGPQKALRSVDVVDDSDSGFFTRLFRWQATIGDFRPIWRLNLPKSDPTLNVRGVGDVGVFQYRFNIKKLPTEKDRVYVQSWTPDGTYQNNFPIRGVVPEGKKIGSQQNSLKRNGNEFTWKFRAEKRGEFNRSELQIKGKETFFAYDEIYKGYPGEVSTRLSTIVGSGGNFILNGELALNYWFEDVFGWTNYYLAQQRWGISTKVFRSLNQVNISGRSNNMQTVTADLKYRLSPGLWGRDESWGLIAGVNQVQFDDFKALQQGVGFFWARSMPRIFDDFFNLFPFMGYPKWVDLEYVYYPSMTGEGVVAGNPPNGAGNWALNFHGKVLWGKQFFGEAGFGIRQLDWIQPLGGKNLRFQFTSLYGTAGLGYSF